jgi:hypothetical protein
VHIWLFQAPAPPQEGETRPQVDLMIGTGNLEELYSGNTLLSFNTGPAMEADSFVTSVG